MAKSVINNKFFAPKSAIKVFFTGIILSFVFMIPAILLGKGMFIYMGDYNGQQIPFYIHCHNVIRSGMPLWDFGTDLGTNFLGSYSYYTVMSPFFWLTIPFPNSWVPYLMGPLLSLKFGCTALTGYLYIRYFTKTDKPAFIGGLLYAFSGWSIYNIFYNQFHESLIIFPLLLLALEKTVNENKRAVFALCVALSAIVNYYFFFGFVVFAILYFLIKTFTKSWNMTIKKFLVLLFESIIGVLISSFILIPSAICVFGMSRTNDGVISGLNFLMYSREIYPCIIQSLFFPPEVPAIQTFNNVETVAWQSLSLYLPFIGPIAVFTYVRRNKDWISKILIISAIFALIPGLNSLFTLLKPIYYARWFMMPILIMALASSKVIEDYNADACKKDFKMVSIITLLIIFITGFIPNKIDGKWVFGIFNRESEMRKYLFIYWSLLAIVQLLLMLSMFYKNPKERIYKKQKKVCEYICLFAAFVAISHTLIGITSANIVVFEAERNEIKVVEQYIEENNDKDEYFRVSVFSENLNLTMFTNLNGQECFHSVVNGSIFDTQKSVIGFERTVNSPNTIVSGELKSLTCSKYLIVDKDYIDRLQEEDDEALSDNVVVDGVKDAYKKYGYALSPNMEKTKEFDNFILYENQNYLPLGVYYDYYITQSDYDKLDENERGLCIANALIVNDNDVAKYKNILKPYNKDNAKAYADVRNNNGLSFKIGKDKMSGTVVSGSERYVLVQMPYEKNGWAATINGKSAQIDVVDGGLMAIKVNKGKNNIEFSYRTPGLNIGLIISGCSLLVLLGYIVLARKVRVR